MASLRTKLFLPLGVLALGLIAFVATVWIPRVERLSQTFFEEQLAGQLDMLGDTLVPLLLTGQFADINDTLDIQIKKNNHWDFMVLEDEHGGRLYPLPGVEGPQGSGYRVVSEPVKAGGRVLGTLRLTVNEDAALRDIRKAHRDLLIALAAAFAVFILVLVFLLEYLISEPLAQLAAAARALKEGRFETALPPPGKDEVGQLAQSFAAMRESIFSYQDDLRQEIGERRRAEESLRVVNDNLKQLVAEEVEKSRAKDHLLIQQSRLAAMGEMVHNIAHQWRQPLNVLSLIFANIKDAWDTGDVDSAFVKRSFEDGNRVIRSMSTTIDDFRNFFRADKIQTDFALLDAVEHAASLVRPAFSGSRIELAVEEEGDAVIVSGFPNEFSQVLLNVLGNARDAILERGTVQGEVRAVVRRQHGRGCVVVSDNGGGIPEKVLAHVFEPYFTTKEKGSGIGLYMSKMIIEGNMLGSIAAANVDGGAALTVCLPLAKEEASGRP